MRCDANENSLRYLLLDLVSIMVHWIPAREQQQQQQYGYHPGLEARDLIRLNVSGSEYVTLRETLDEFPGTLLGSEERRRGFFVESLNAHLFNRHRECFEAILYYYQTCGTLFRPTHIPMDVFVREA